MVWRWLIWLIFGILWTWALLYPDPEGLVRALFLADAEDANEVEPFRRELFHAIISGTFSKTLHVLAYTVFTVLSGWVKVPWRFRGWLLVFLSLHAFGTEFLQSFTATRHPSLRDAGLDHLGIVLGLGLAYRWWMAGRKITS